MVLKKNILAGNNNFLIFYLVFFFLISITNSNSDSKLEGNFTDIKILDKISSKNILLKLKNGELLRYKDLSIQSLKCKNFGV